MLRWVSPNGLQTQAVLNNGNGVGNNVNSSVRSKYGRFTWTAIPSNSMVNEFRFGWFNDKQFDYPNDALAIPGIGFLGISVTGQTNLGTATDYPAHQPQREPLPIRRHADLDARAATRSSSASTSRARKTTPNLLFNRTGTYTFPNLQRSGAGFSGNTTGAQGLVDIHADHRQPRGRSLSSRTTASSCRISTKPRRGSP